MKNEKDAGIGAISAQQFQPTLVGIKVSQAGFEIKSALPEDCPTIVSTSGFDWRKYTVRSSLV